MDKFEPDHLSYSYKELLDVHTHINRAKYPERFELVEKLISEKAEESEAVNEEYSGRDKAIFGMLGGELLFWLLVGLAALLGYSIF
jgi:hypothetical protein